MSELLNQLTRTAAARDVLEVRRITGAIRRHKIGILLLACGMTALVFYYLQQIPDLYRAQAKIIIEGDRKRVTRIEDVNEPLNPGAFTNSTQSAILQSRIMAEKVITELGIDHLPEQIQKPSKETLITQFLSGLLVQPSDHSSVVTLEYVSNDPQFAARALNTLLDVYLEDQLQEKNSVTHNATRWLAQRVEEMRNKVIDSENRLEQLRRSSDSLYIEGKSLYQDQLIQLSTDLMTAKKERSETETKLQKFAKMMRRAEEAETTQFIMESPLMEAIETQEQALEAKMAQMQTRYRDEHPMMRSLFAEKDALEERKADKLQRVRLALMNDRDLLSMRIRNIANDITSLRVPLENESDIEITMRGLKSEIEANKELFTVLLARYKETDVQDEVIHAPDARVISRAYPPTNPFEPKRIPVIIATFILSIIGAIAISMVREFSSVGFQNGEQLELETGLQVVATIPEFKTTNKEINHLQMLDAALYPLYAEATRNLRTVLFDDSATAPKVLLISSSLQEEGKSSTALSLAVILQKTGKKVLLIDADMRRSQLAKSLKLGKVPGLGDVLSGQAQVQDVFYKDSHSGISCIPAGEPQGHPLDLLQLQAMGQLMQLVRSQFDTIIVDAPPVMSVRDAALLAPHADACLYIVRWEKTPRGAVNQGIKLLQEKFSNKPFMLALSRINLKKQRYYKSSKEEYLYFTNYAFKHKPQKKD